MIPFITTSKAANLQCGLRKQDTVIFGAEVWGPGGRSWTFEGLGKVLSLDQDGCNTHVFIASKICSAAHV